MWKFSFLNSIFCFLFIFHTKENISILWNRRFPSCLSPLFQSESWYEAFYMEISFIHTQILVHLHVNRGQRQLRNRLLSACVAFYTWVLLERLKIQLREVLETLVCPSPPRFGECCVHPPSYVTSLKSPNKVEQNQESTILHLTRIRRPESFTKKHSRLKLRILRLVMCDD